MLSKQNYQIKVQVAAASCYNKLAATLELQAICIFSITHFISNCIGKFASNSSNWSAFGDFILLTDFTHRYYSPILLTNITHRVANFKRGKKVLCWNRTTHTLKNSVTRSIISSSWSMLSKQNNQIKVLVAAASCYNKCGCYLGAFCNLHILNHKLYKLKYWQVCLKQF